MENADSKIHDLFTDKDYIWCLVGNVLSEGVYLEGNKEIEFSGTKQFKPETKVYCSPYIWGDGYERIRVIGRAWDNDSGGACSDTALLSH